MKHGPEPCLGCNKLHPVELPNSLLLQSHRHSQELPVERFQKPMSLQYTMFHLMMMNLLDLMGSLEQTGPSALVGPLDLTDQLGMGWGCLVESRMVVVGLSHRLWEWWWLVEMGWVNMCLVFRLELSVERLEFHLVGL